MGPLLKSASRPATTWSATCARVAPRFITIIPKLVVGCVSNGRDKILLCRRAIRPHTDGGRARQLHGKRRVDDPGRPARAAKPAHRVAIDDLFALVHVPHINQVHLFYRGRLLGLESFAAGAKVSKRRCSAENIRWRSSSFVAIACLAACASTPPAPAASGFAKSWSTKGDDRASLSAFLIAFQAELHRQGDAKIARLEAFRQRGDACRLAQHFERLLVGTKRPLERTRTTSKSALTR